MRSPDHLISDTNSSFKPAWGLGGAHRQTMFPTLFRSRPRIQPESVRLQTPDNDFLDIKLTPGFWQPQNRAKPVVFIFHGLEGNFNSKYASGLFAAVAAQGWRSVFLIFRNCGSEPNRQPYSYHAAAIQDPEFIIRYFHEQDKKAPLGAVGFSIGGNILLNYLAAWKKRTRLRAAAAVSVPYDLKQSVLHIHRWQSRVYEKYLMSALRSSVEKKIRTGVWPENKSKHLRALLKDCKTIYEFDDKFTAPIHGFGNAENYYRQASSLPKLARIITPALLIHAEDDPFMPMSVVPRPGDLPANIKLELSAHGGHVGFVAGNHLFQPQYWLETHVIEYFKNFF